MHLSVLAWIRCPFCGTSLSLVESSPLVRAGDVVESGVLGCECCAYPIVDGIPVLIADDTTRAAMHALEAGESSRALHILLGLDDQRAADFEALRRDQERLSYRTCIEVLSPDPEGTYFVYRFSDPTYVMAQSVLQAVCLSGRATGPALDLCGGSGHLTREICALKPDDDVVLADVFYWKLWLARVFTAPRCIPICCDANNPLPFDRGTFGLTVLSDAFPYIWHKRLLADEMVRSLASGGTLVMPHLHSSLGENFSAGMTLTPASYRDLFAAVQPRLFADQVLLDGILERGEVDLTSAAPVDALGTTPSITLVASPHTEIFARRALPVPAPVEGELRVNPLYEIHPANGHTELVLRFPNAEYEAEFGDCRRYLPESTRVPGDARGALTLEALGDEAVRLRRRRVVLDVPPRYC